jgi:hypothetical protein
MAKAFNLTAQINLQGPTNLKPIVANIRRQLSGIKVDLDIDVKANAARNIADITSRLQTLSTAATTATRNINQLDNALRGLTSSLSTVTNANNSFNQTAQSVGANLSKSNNQVQNASTAVEKFGQSAALAVKRFAAFSSVTTIVNQFTSAITAGFKEFIDYDRQLVKIAQTTNGSANQIRALSNEITSLAKKFGASSTELAQVSLTLAQAGLSADETRIALEALAKTTLAASFDDINSTTEGSIALLRQFKISTNELESALGSINAVAAAFAVESADIITAIQRTGGVFASASKGVAEGRDALNQFIAVFTSVRATTRESAETIATGLRTIFTRIQRGSTIKFLREFGVELQDSQGKFIGAYESIRRLSEALSTLDPRDVRFTQIVEELGGFRQIGKVIPLIQEFSTAEKALSVAQRGQTSLTSDAIQAQAALAVQFAKTRESFLALIRDIGQSATFQTIIKFALGLANAFIQVASALKPILPLITALTAVKGFKFITEFISGFSGAFSAGGGVSAAGRNLGASATGTNATSARSSTSNNIAALNNNTTALNSLTTQVMHVQRTMVNATNALANVIRSTRTGGNPPTGFARGGLVPGNGNRDTVPAMLTPGEFVIRKSSVGKLGIANLAAMNNNRYANGGLIDEDNIGAAILENVGFDSPSVKVTRKDIENKLPNNLKLSDNYPIKSQKTFTLQREGLSESTFKKFSQILDNNLIAVAENSAAGLAATLGLSARTSIPQDQINNFLTGINNASRGNLFEDTLKVLSGNTFDVDPQRAFDFSRGLSGVLKDDYTNLTAKYVDAKASLKKSTVAAFETKTANALAQEAKNIDEFTRPETNEEAKKRNAELYKVKKKNLGGIIQKFVGGGIAKAPLIDDINNATGTLMPRPGSAVSALISAGGGSIDIDRTIKRTIGDQAYARANTQQEQTAVLNRYFRDPKTRLEDIKSAPLTAFGEDLRSAIASKQLNPNNISIVSKSRRVPGVAEYLSELFGIPLSNMIFTQGGDKQPAIDALRAKGPRSSRVARFASGGSVGTDTVPALLTPGEFVINRKSAQRIGYGNLNRMNKVGKYAKGGPVQYFANGTTGSGAQQQRFVNTQSNVITSYIKEKLGGSIGVISASIAALTPTINDLATSFDQINQTAYTTTSAFASFSKGLERASSLGLSGAIAGAQIGGRAGVLAGGIGLVGGALSGAIEGYINKEIEKLSTQTAQANIEVSKALEDFSSAINLQEQLDAQNQFLQASVRLTSSLNTAADASDSWAARGSRAFSSLFDTAMAGIATFATIKLARGKQNGGVVYASGGKLVQYKPKGTDTVPAMLTPGEFVVNAKSTKKNIGLLKAINKNKGGKISYLANGGIGGLFGTAGYFDYLNRNLNPFTSEDVTEKDKGLQKVAQAAALIAVAAAGAAGAGALAAGGGSSALTSGAGRAGLSQAARAAALRRAPGAVGKAGSQATRAASLRRGAGGASKMANTSMLARLTKSIKGFSGSGVRKMIGNVGGKIGVGGALSLASMIPGAIAVGRDVFSSNAQTLQLRQQARTGSFQNLIKAGELATTTLPQTDQKRTTELVDQFNALQGTREDKRRVLGEQASLGEGILAEQMKKALEAAGEDSAQAGTKLLEQTYSTIREQELAAAGKSGEEIARIIDTELKAGLSADNRERVKAELGKQEELLRKRLAEESQVKNLAKSTADFTAVMVRLQASFERINDEIDNSVKATDSYVNSLRGTPSAAAAIAGTADVDAQRLSNLSAYTTQELDQTLNNVVKGLGGGANIQQGADLVRGLQVLEKIRPTIEASVKAGGANVDQAGITAQLEEAFKDINIDEKELKKEFIGAAARSIAGQGVGEGAGSKGLDAFIQKSEQARKVFEEYAKTAAKGLKTLAEQSDKLAQSLIRVQELEIQSKEVGLQSQLDLREALGLKSTQAQKEAPLNARISAMTGGITDPSKIGDSIMNMVRAQQKVLEDENKGPQEKAALMATPAFAGLTKSIEQSRKALEILANDTSKADRALQKIAQREQQLKVAGDTALDIIANPAKGMELLAQRQAAQRVMAGRGTPQDVQAGREFLRAAEQMMDPEAFRQLMAKFAEGAFRGAGVGGQFRPFAPAFATTEAGKREDPVLAAQMDAYNSAVAERIAAINALAALEKQAGDALGENLIKINDRIRDKLSGVVQQIEVELIKFKDALNVANGGAAPAPPIPVPPAAPLAAAAAVPAPGAPAAVASTITPPVVAPIAATAATQVPVTINAEQIGQQLTTAIGAVVPDEISLVAGGTTNVVVTFNVSDIKMLDNLKENIQKDTMNQLAVALSNATNGKIRLPTA